MNAALLFIFTIFSLVSFGAILWGADPYSADLSVRTLFFASMFFSFVGIFTLFGIWGSKLFGRPLGFKAALRRGFLFSALAISIIILETFSVLNIGNVLAVFLVVVALEMIAIYKK